MVDARKLLDDLLTTSIPGTGNTVRETADQAVRLAKDNPIASGAIALALLGTSPGRAIAGSVLRIGGLAAVAGLAYKAYQNYQQGGAAGEASADAEILPPPQGSAFDPEQAPQGGDEFALAVVRAMIAAANADGHIDEEERARIHERLIQSGVDDEEGELLRRELANPQDIEALAASVRSDAQKVELYTASRIALQPESPVERDYLARLASRLGLPEALVEHIEATLAAAR